MKISRDTQTMARRLFRLCLVDGLLDDDRVRKVSATITSGKWRSKLALLVAFTRLVKLQQDKRRATVWSAVPLTGDEQDKITGRLEQRYGRGLHFEWVVDPSLIAGIRVKVADDVTDGTIKTRIDNLQKINLH